MSHKSLLFRKAHWNYPPIFFKEYQIILNLSTIFVQKGSFPCMNRYISMYEKVLGFFVKEQRGVSLYFGFKLTLNLVSNSLALAFVIMTDSSVLFTGDPRNYGSAERFLQLAIETTLNIGNHIIIHPWL